MDKLKLKALKLGANAILTRAQMKTLTGGDGTCRHYYSSGGFTFYGGCESATVAANQAGHYCCNSCVGTFGFPACP